MSGKIRIEGIARLCILTGMVFCFGCGHIPGTGKIHEAPSSTPEQARAWRPPDAPKAMARPERPSEQERLPHYEGETLSLAEALQVGLANNLKTKTAWLQLQAEKAGAGESAADYYPSIDVSAGMSYGKPAGGTRSTTEQTRYGLAETLTYLLLDMGGRKSALESAEASMIVAGMAYNAVLQETVLRIEDAYVQHLKTNALISAAQAALEEAELAMASVKAKHEAGVASLADVLQARTALSQARLGANNLKGQQEIVRGALAVSMGLPSGSSFDVGELPAGINTEFMGRPVDELIERALADRPDLMAARARILKAETEIRRARSEGKPALYLDLSANQENVRQSGVDNQESSYNAALELRFPLFTGYKNTHQIKRAEIEARIAQAAATDMENRIALEIWTGYHAFRNAVERVASSEDFIRSARELEQVTLERYKVGAGSILDHLSAVSALAEARAGNIEARADLFLSLAYLARDLGAMEFRFSPEWHFNLNETRANERD